MKETSSIELPTKEDNMLPRQCPKCDRKFSINIKSYRTLAYLNIRCPYCRWIEEFDNFVTDEQVNFAEAIGKKKVVDMVKDEFSDFDIEVESSRSSIPSPYLSEETKEITCPECGFKYKVKDDTEKRTFCPVCR